MRFYSSVLAIVIAALLTQSCSSTGQPPTQVAANFINREKITIITHDKYPAKNPRTVAMYKNENTLSLPYRVIGVATVAKHNILGMKRNDSTIHDMMKKLAASIGGDGIINMDNSKEKVEAKVIAFQKILI